MKTATLAFPKAGSIRNQILATSTIPKNKIAAQIAKY